MTNPSSLSPELAQEVERVQALYEKATPGRLKAVPVGSYQGLRALLVREQAEGVEAHVTRTAELGAYPEFQLYAALVNLWPALRSRLTAAEQRVETCEAALRELRNIESAERFNREHFRDDTEFADWAQSRARHTLARAALTQPQEPK